MRRPYYSMVPFLGMALFFNIVSMTHTQATTEADVTGACGTATETPTATEPTTICSSGEASSVYGEGPWLWVCIGSGSGSSVVCDAQKGGSETGPSCGTSNGKTLETAPTEAKALCNPGTATEVKTDTEGTSFVWTCKQSGATATCAATIATTTTDSECGAANGQTVVAEPTDPTDLCSAGTASALTTMSTGFAWTCTGASTVASCAATAAVAEGVCGSAAGQTLSYAPTASADLCSAGTASSVATGLSTFTWTCEGLCVKVSCSATNSASSSSSNSNSNSNSNCSGNSNSNSSPAVNGQCSSSTPGSCTSGYPTNVTTSYGVTTWICTGSNGGSSASCSASTNSFPSCDYAKHDCSNGYVSMSTQLSTGYIQWICTNPTSGMSISCSSYSGTLQACGSLDGTYTETEPVISGGVSDGRFCASGYMSGGSVTPNDSGWTWQCVKPGTGESKTCSVYKSQSTGKYCPTTTPKPAFTCKNGASPDPSSFVISEDGTSISWDCKGATAKETCTEGSCADTMPFSCLLTGQIDTIKNGKLSASADSSAISVSGERFSAIKDVNGLDGFLYKFTFSNSRVVYMYEGSLKSEGSKTSGQCTAGSFKVPTAPVTNTKVTLNLPSVGANGFVCKEETPKSLDSAKVHCETFAPATVERGGSFGSVSPGVAAMLKSTSPDKTQQKYVYIFGDTTVAAGKDPTVFFKQLQNLSLSLDMQTSTTCNSPDLM